jgi:hypothetical protein
MILRFFCERAKATPVALARRLYCGQILTKEGAAYDPLELIQERLRARRCQLVAQCVNFTESGAQ